MQLKAIYQASKKAYPKGKMQAKKAQQKGQAKGAAMEQQLMSLAIETYKITLFLSLPVLFIALIMGLLISIFQATTQINEMTLAFVPKILAVIAMIIFTMPWMLNMLMDFTRLVVNMIPKIIS